ncbi:MAG: DUF4272 domain-containing protein [Planctomycetota bacterium]
MTILVNAYCTARDLPAISFPHDLVAQRDESDPEMQRHLSGFAGYILDGGEREMTSVRYALLQHLFRTQHQISLNIESEQLEDLSLWAWAANAVLFLPDGSVRDPNGAVLSDHEHGMPDDNAQLPYPQDARQRKADSEIWLRNLLIDTPETLPPVVGEGEVLMRVPPDVAGRMRALFLVAVRAEGAGTAQQIPIESMRQRMPDAFMHLTPKETAFLRDASPDEQTVMNMSWRYESLFTLQWACGLHSELPFPDTMCNVPAAAEIAMSTRTVQLRNTDEILSELDRNYRLLWAARQAISENRDAPANIDGNVVVERQHALNWLVRFQQADWDDVDTPS